jgi:DNA-binding GntR family transcriptional regulator
MFADFFRQEDIRRFGSKDPMSFNNGRRDLQPEGHMRRPGPGPSGGRCLPVTLRANLRPLRPDALVSINDLVTRTIREAILKGALPPGARLQQDRLAAELRVSRQPVREALRRLQAEGLVVQLPQRWMAVQTFSAEAIRENYRLRSVLESEAARAAAQSIRPPELGKLKGITKTMVQATSADRESSSKIISLNHQFHRLIWESSRMPTLLRFIEQLWVGRTIFTPLFIPGRARRSAAEHEMILHALERHDPAAAAENMQAHITHAAGEYFANYERQGASAAKPPGLLADEAEHPC